jgi:tRNA (guanine37-N1)-methyltransferase
MRKIPQDIIGDIAILKFPKSTFWVIRKIKAFIFLKRNKSIKTVLEKTEGFSGELRTLKTRYLAGIRTKEAFYRESGCVFNLNVESAYFSPRLSNERKVIGEEVAKIAKKRGTRILVMFAGVSPYSIVTAKKLIEKSKKAEIFSNELNEKANIYARKNILLNGLKNYITLVGGDAEELPKKLKNKFDIIIMPRPNLKKTFLKTALMLSKKGTIIYYYGFGSKEEVLNEIKSDTRGKIGKILIRKAGDVGPRRYRWQAKFKVE